MIKIDSIIDLKSSVKWVVLLCIYLFAGAFAKKFFGYINIALFLMFIVGKRPDYSLYLTVFWIFTSRFFLGMRYLEFSGINNQIEKIFLVILIIINLKSQYNLSKGSFISKVSWLHIILFIICLITVLSYHYNFLRIIVSLNYFMLFLVIIISSYEKIVYVNIFNLLLAIGIVQVPVAAFQYYGIIYTPPIDISMGYSVLKMNAGLDDVACGTFGPMASPDLSMFLTILTAILFCCFFIEKNKLYLYWAFFYLLQYLVVDSKTVLGTSLLVFALIFVKVFNMKNIKVASFKLSNLWLILAFSIVFGLGIKSYYNSSFGKGMDFNFYKKYIKQSFSIVYNNIGDWGKITGFRQVYNQQYKEGKLHNVLFGFGLEEYDKANRRFLLKNKVSSKMKLLNYANNFMNNDSTLITIYAEVGIIGFLILLLAYFSIYNFFPRTTFISYFPVVIQTVVNPLLLGILLVAFLSFALNINSFSIIGLWLIIAIALKLEEIAIPNEAIPSITPS